MVRIDQETNGVVSKRMTNQYPVRVLAYGGCRKRWRNAGYDPCKHVKCGKIVDIENEYVIAEMVPLIRQAV